MLDTWERDFEVVQAAIDRRFRGVKCLRCQGKSFGLRLFHDASLVPAFSQIGENNVAELICDTCGFMERHVIGRLVDGDK
jgi:hypothetical protein